ncbi:hypothetical protein [Chitinophaga solisilvae]|nr:hypothetical protein [Chitinophaga solisilvae]
MQILAADCFKKQTGDKEAGPAYRMEKLLQQAYSYAARAFL